MPQSFLPHQAKINQDSNQALIFSPHHLLAYHLAFHLAQQNLKVTWFHLPPSQPTFPSPDPRIEQKSLSTTPSQADWSPADYAFFLYPFDSRLNLTQFLPLLTSTATKLTFTARFAQKDSLLQKLEPQLSSSVNYRNLLLDHLFGPYLLTTDAGFTEKIFSHLWQRQPLTLPADPQTKLLPLYVKDAILALTKATFTPQTSQQLFAPSPLEPTSLTDFALALEDPAAEYLDFQPDLDLTQKTQDLKLPDQQLITHTQAQLDWQPQTDLNISLRQTFNYFSQHSPQPPQTPSDEPKPSDQGTPPSQKSLSQEPSSEKPSAPKEPTPQLTPLQKSQADTSLKAKLPGKFKKLALALSQALLITLLIFSPLIYFIALSYQGINSLQTSLQQLRSANYQQSITASQRSHRRLTSARQFLGTANQLLPGSLLDHKLTKYDRYFDVGLRLATILDTTAHAAQKGEQLYQIITDPQSTNFTQTNNSLQTDLDYLYNQLSLLQTSLNQLDIQSRLKYINQLKQIKNKLPDLRQRLELGLAALDLLPQLINTPQPQTYLLLVQNNQELRPTGGFISTIALLTFQDGHLIQTKTLPVYQADSQLEGQVDAPAPLQQYLGEDSWYLRDSNWHPHFPTSADQAQWFVQKELNQSVSGTVAVNLISLQKILSATGPLKLNQPSLTIDAQNLAQQVNQYTLPTNQPNSTPQLLTPLTEKLLSTLTTQDIDFVALVRALSQSLNQQEITLYLNSPQLQAVIEQNNWSGSLAQKGCPNLFNQTYCTSQTFSLIEANLGINKANYSLSRRLQHTLNIQPQGQLNHQITLNYQNNTSPDTPSSGAYKTYTRFYLPSNTQLVSSQFNQQPLPPQDISLDPFLNLKTIAFYYTVPAQSTGQLKLTLRSQEILNTLSPTSSLAINWQKQSGTGSLPTTLTINHPQTLTPQKITLPARTPPQSLIFTQPLESDTLYSVQFSRQSQ